MCFKNGKITPILGPFRAKTAKTAQIWRPVSQQRDNIFRFGKKFLAPHNQEMKICENEKNKQELLRTCDDIQWTYHKCNELL